MVMLYNFNKSSYENVSWSKLTYPVLHSFPLFLLCRPCNQFSTAAESSIFLYCFCTAWGVNKSDTLTVLLTTEPTRWWLSCPVFWATQACVSACSIIYYKIGLFLSESQWDQWRPFRWEKESMFINIDSKEERGVETFYCIKKDIFKDALIEGC